jgi:ATP-dependent DNA helicase PIF1
MTIHKIQGATLPMASIDVGGQIFEYGQTYVALSRVESLDGLYLTAFHAEKVRANERVIEFYSRMLKQDYVLEENTSLSAGLVLNTVGDGRRGVESTNMFKQYAYSELSEEEYVDPTIKRIVL